MDKSHAKYLSEQLDNYQLQQMIDKARENIKDWTTASKINKGISKGVAWNVLAKDFDINRKLHNIVKYNLIREYGEFLPEGFQQKKKPKTKTKPFHQNPIF